MSWPLLLLCLAGSAPGTELAATADQRIIGGQESHIGKVPYLVYLRVRSEFICGGSLLTASCVLSAAHCVYGGRAADYTVHAGASRLNETAPIVRGVASFIVAPQYAPATADMDVAILQLASRIDNPLAGRVATIAPCQSPAQSNAYAKISGWGVTKENSREPSTQVRTANVRVLSMLQCKLAYAGQAQITDSMFCATVRGIRDSCSGDSGGPAVHRGQVCGIVSWGFGCARAAYPGVYTSVGSARVHAFIEQTLREHCG